MRNNDQSTLRNVRQSTAKHSYEKQNKAQQRPRKAKPSKMRSWAQLKQNEIKVKQR